MDGWITISTPPKQNKLLLKSQNQPPPKLLLMASQTPLSVLFIPWYATGHLLPLVDIAVLFASRPNTSSTILTTPSNLPIIQPTITHHPSIQTLLYPFPSSPSNLPPNAENIASVPAAESHKFDAATLHARPAIESLIHLQRPNVIVADIHFTWIFEIAAEMGIPFLVFHAIGLFPIAVLRALYLERANHDDEAIKVPGFPHDVRFPHSELPSAFLPNFGKKSTNGDSIWSKLREMEDKSLGYIVNSFAGIETEYADYFIRVHGYRSWFVGPVAVAVKVTLMKTTKSENEQLLGVRGGKVDGNGSRCLDWLGGQLARSVVYVCFGSWCHFSDEQIGQLALGLERCGHPFLWVVKEDSMGFLPQGFEERVKGKGLVVRGWAPQVTVLGHVAVGGFMTHCGWNSLLEGLTAGLPMATWPLVFEQFINEKLVTEVLRVGVKCRRGVGSTVEEEKVVVGAEEVTVAVRRIMNEGEEEEEATGMRRRAREYATKAEEAVKEGGSSYKGLTSLIEELRALARK